MSCQRAAILCTERSTPLSDLIVNIGCKESHVRYYNETCSSAVSSSWHSVSSSSHTHRASSSQKLPSWAMGQLVKPEHPQPKQARNPIIRLTFFGPKPLLSFKPAKKSKSPVLHSVYLFFSNSICHQSADLGSRSSKLLVVEPRCLPPGGPRGSALGVPSSPGKFRCVRAA